VTLIYPFTDDSQLGAGRISDVRALLEERPAFQFQLAEVRRFDDLPKESYVWLAPTPSQPFVEVVKALAAVFPEHPPFDGAFATIVPHLTIAASADEDLLDCVASQVADALPIKARAETARIMQHVGGRWRVRAEVSLAPLIAKIGRRRPVVSRGVLANTGAGHRLFRRGTTAFRGRSSSRGNGGAVPFCIFKFDRGGRVSA
jgi:hypothetical protein